MSKMKIAYCVTTRQGKSYWNRIGVAFVNRDGSINVKLDSIPVDGQLQLRDYTPDSKELGYTKFPKNQSLDDYIDSLRDPWS